MTEEKRQEEVAAIIGTLSAVDLQLQQVEETSMKRANVFLEEANQTDSPTGSQFNTIGHLLREIHDDVHEIREYIDLLEKFLREGKCEEEILSCTTSSSSRPYQIDPTSNEVD